MPILTRLWNMKKYLFTSIALEHTEQRLDGYKSQTYKHYPTFIASFPINLSRKWHPCTISMFVHFTNTRHSHYAARKHYFTQDEKTFISIFPYGLSCLWLKFDHILVCRYFIQSLFFTTDYRRHMTCSWMMNSTFSLLFWHLTFHAQTLNVCCNNIISICIIKVNMFVCTIVQCNNAEDDSNKIYTGWPRKSCTSLNQHIEATVEEKWNRFHQNLPWVSGNEDQVHVLCNC